MLGLRTLAVGATRSTEQPFDVDLSLTLDDVIIQLEAGAAGLRRRWLLLQQRWYERHVPAWYAEVR